MAIQVLDMFEPKDASLLPKVIKQSYIDWEGNDPYAVPNIPDAQPSAGLYFGTQTDAQASSTINVSAPGFMSAKGAIVVFRLQYDTVQGQMLTVRNTDQTHAVSLFGLLDDTADANVSAAQYKAGDLLMCTFGTSNATHWKVIGVGSANPLMDVDTALDDRYTTHAKIPTSKAVTDAIKALWNDVITPISNKIGTLSSLTTNAKNNIVAAINELRSSILTLTDDVSGKEDTLNGNQRAAINSGITLAKRTQYDAYASNKQDKLNNAQMESVNSGITRTQNKYYLDNVGKIGSSVNRYMPLHILRREGFNITGNTITRGTSGQISVNALSSQIFTINREVDLTIYSASLYNSSTYAYYLAIFCNGEWMLGKEISINVHATVTVDPITYDPDDEAADDDLVIGDSSSSSSSTTTLLGINVSDGWLASNVLGCKAAIIIARKDGVAMTEAEKNTLSDKTIKLDVTAESVQSAIAFCEQDANRYTKQVTPTTTILGTYRAKVTNGTYYTVSSNVGDPTYNLYAIEVGYDYHNKPDIRAVEGTLLARRGTGDTLTLIPSNEIYGSGLTSFFIIGETSDLSYIEVSPKTIAQAIADGETDHATNATAIAANAAAIQQQAAIVNSYAWQTFATAADLQPFLAQDGNPYASQGITTRYEIPLDATSGNRFFDLRGMNVSVRLDINGLCTNETVILIDNPFFFDINPSSAMLNQHIWLDDTTCLNEAGHGRTLIRIQRGCITIKEEFTPQATT